MLLTLSIIIGGGLVVLTWLGLISTYITKQNVEISERKLNLRFKELMFEREAAINTQNFLKILATKMGAKSLGELPKKGLPPEIQDLIASSPDHEEVQEIDENDELIGVIFNSAYPPEFSEND